MSRAFGAIYSFFIVLPDRMYPFASQVEGQWVRGRRSYKHAVRKATRKYGFGSMGYKIALYREVFHFVGSILFIALTTMASHTFFNSQTALYVLFFAAIIALSYQEFYLHPKRYGQHFKKGLADWLTWVMPIVAYLFSR